MRRGCWAPSRANSISRSPQCSGINLYAYFLVQRASPEIWLTCRQLVSCVQFKRAHFACQRQAVSLSGGRERERERESHLASQLVAVWPHSSVLPRSSALPRDTDCRRQTSVCELKLALSLSFSLRRQLNSRLITRPIYISFRPLVCSLVHLDLPAGRPEVASLRDVGRPAGREIWRPDSREPAAWLLGPNMRPPYNNNDNLGPQRAPIRARQVAVGRAWRSH